LDQSSAHLEGVGWVVESYYNKVAHVYFLWLPGFIVLFQTVNRSQRRNSFHAGRKSGFEQLSLAPGFSRV
jgi:hypothetical protein